MKEEKTKELVDHEASTVHQNDAPTSDKPTKDNEQDTGIEMKGANVPGLDVEEYPNIPKEVVADLKEKYRIIFGNYFNGKPVLYRVFNVDEYLQYQEDMLQISNKLQEQNNALPMEQRSADDEMSELIAKKADEMLVERFTVYPENIIEKVESKEYPGGVVYNVANGILVNNGFVDLDVMYLNKEDIDSDPELLKTIDSSLLNDVDDLTSSQLVKDMIEPHGEIAAMWFLNQLYIVRGFSYDEYSDIRKLSNSLDPIHFAISLVRQFALYPRDIVINDVPAGMVIKCLSDAILAISGFSNPNPDIVIME